MLLNRKQRRQTKHSEGSWAVSYVDMLTLLLCFFIIFYSNKQNHPEENLLQKIAFDLSGKPSAGNVAGKGDGTDAGTGTGMGTGVGSGNVTITQDDFALLELIKTKLKNELPADIKTGEKSLEINFEGISFFESGKTKLLPQAEVQIEKVITLLSKYKDIVRVTVQGHTDP